MKTILKNETIECRKINVSSDESIINYILNNEKTNNFLLVNITEEDFSKLNSSDNCDDILHFKKGKTLFGYVPETKVNFKTCGGLKCKNENDKIAGNFIIKKDKVIYCPCAYDFIEEKEYYPYAFNYDIYYTTMKTPELLSELLNSDKECFIDTGRTKKIKDTYLSEKCLLKITKKEMLLCASNPIIGKKIYDDYLKKSYIVSEEDENFYKKTLKNS